MIYKIYAQWQDGRANGYWVSEIFSSKQDVERQTKELNNMFGGERQYEVQAFNTYLHEIVEI